MRILFLHQNAPGQFRHLAPHLAQDPANDVVFLFEGGQPQGGRVRWRRYKPPGPAGAQTHHYLRRMEASVRRGQEVVRACLVLAAEGFTPDIVVAHPGWGETLFLREVLPHARILSYCELFYQPHGQDTGYIPETALDLDGRCRLRAWNADLLAALNTMDRGLAPTDWQKVQHPATFQSQIAVIHEGVDVMEVAPKPQARFRVPDGPTFIPGDELITYVARHLEPVRGFGFLLRALPDLLRRRPGAHIVICGEDGESYGRPPPGGGTWREALLREVPVDPARVHFVGRLSRPDYLALLQVSALHLYLSVPFVLSWSCVEALAAGCLLLASDVAPVREVIEDGTAGVLIDPRDPAALSRRAAELLAGRDAFGSMRRRARETAMERFDLRRCVQAQTQLIQELAA